MLPEKVREHLGDVAIVFDNEHANRLRLCRIVDPRIIVDWRSLAGLRGFDRVELYAKGRAVPEAFARRPHLASMRPDNPFADGEPQPEAHPAARIVIGTTIER